MGLSFLCCEYVLLPLVNNKADWPIARQDKVRRDNQTKDLDEEGYTPERREPAAQ